MHNDWPHRKQWVLLPLNLNVYLGLTLGNIEGLGGNKTHSFHWGQSLSAYCSPNVVTLFPQKISLNNKSLNE